MLWFWVALALLIVAATACVVWPLLYGSHDVDASAASADEARRLAVYRDRRREIEAERDAGRLSDEEAKRSLDELLAEAAVQFPGQSGGASSKGAAPRPVQRPLVAWGMAATALVPLVSLLIYSQIGSPALIGGGAAQSASRAPHESAEKILAELNERVRKAPGDGEAWEALAEVQKATGNAQAAVASYEKALGLLPETAGLLAGYSEALMMTQAGDFSGKPTQLLERALRLDPKDGDATLLMGVAQYRAGNLDDALRYMKTSQAGVSPQSDRGQLIAQMVARIESDIAAGKGGAPAAGKAGPPVAKAGPIAPGAQMPPGHPPIEGAGAPQPAPGAAPAIGTPSGASISGTITVDDNLRKQVPPGAVVFVIARAPEGPRLPFAVQRLTVDRWPVRFELGDAQTMDPSRPLSGAGKVVIEARVSMTGDVTRKSGDPFGVSAPVAPGANNIAIRLDQRVP
jgi:cytochrome c-type biogenesis protein CcmH